MIIGDCRVDRFEVKKMKGQFKKSWRLSQTVVNRLTTLSIFSVVQ